MKFFVPLVLALVPGLVAAASAQEPADLPALLREAQARNPEIAATAARLAAAGKARSRVEASSDPMISFAYLNDGVRSFTLGESEFSYLSFTWTQEIARRSRRTQAGEIAASEAGRSARDLDRARLEVAAAVKIAFADLYRLDRAGAVLRETGAVLATLVEAARTRYETGEGTQESVLKAQTEIVRLQTDLARVTEERRAAEIRLNAAVGRLEDVPLGPADRLPDVVVPADPEGLADAAVAASPVVLGLESAVQGQEAGVRLAQVDLKPDYIWSASYQNRDGLDPMVMGMFGVRLPIHREKKQAQALSQKESELLAARRDLDLGRVRTRATVRDTVARAERADRLATLVGQGVIPLARSAFESARASYGAGRTSFLDMQNDLTALLAARIDLAAQEAERFQAVAALEPLVARELIAIPGPAPGEGGDDVQPR